MSIRSYVVGLLALAGVVAPLTFAVLRARARLVPDWDGAKARLVEIVLLLTGVLGVCEVLGSIGSFRLLPIVAACAALGIGGGLLVGRVAVGPRRKTEPSLVRRLDVAALVAVAAAIAVLGAWAVRVVPVLREGPISVDTQVYHLPSAAEFVREGSITRLHFGTVDDATPYHPLNTELLHGLGMLAFRRDVLSPFFNFGWLIVAYVGAWVAGERWRRGPFVLTATSAVFGTPLLVESQPGSAMTDVASVALLITSLALLLHSRGRSAAIGLAGLAAGLAVGTKLTIVPAVALLTAAVFFAGPRDGLKRWKVASLWLVPLIATGSFWYVRNLIRVGNPIPSLRLGIGDISLPRPPIELIDRYGYSVADYLFDGSVWRRSFLPGLTEAFGPGWPLFLVGGGLLLLWTLARPRTSLVRAVACVGTGSAVAYAITPTTALGLRGQPTLFVGNLRYLMPALVIAYIVGASIFDEGTRRREFGATVIAAVPLVIAAVFSTGLIQGRTILMLAVVSAAGAVAWFFVVRVSAPRSFLAAGLFAALLASCVTGYALQRSYLLNRYRSHSYVSGGPDREIFSRAQSLRERRIGVAGFFINYPLYGADLSNRVDYIGDHRADGAFTDFKRCGEWRRAVNRGSYDYVVTMPPFPDRPEPPAAEWTSSDPAVMRVLDLGKYSLFRIDGQLDPSLCPS